MVSKHLEIHAAVIVLLAVGSFIAALSIYANVQVIAQERLVAAYRAAKFEERFCDGNVALDSKLCGESYSMGPQQIHAILVAAQVIDVSDMETAEKLWDAPPVELKDLLETLQGEVDYSDKTALGLIVRLSNGQCMGSQTRPAEQAASDRSENQDGKELENGSSEGLKNSLAKALSDALGVSDWRSAMQFGDERCGAAREELQEEGFGNDPSPVDQGRDWNPLPPSGLRFATARCVSDKLILSRLLARNRAIHSTPNDSDESAGYDLTGKCKLELKSDQTSQLKRLEAYTKLMMYVLSQIHTEPNVRRARKIANLLRGPEHVGILALALMATTLVVVRWTALERRFTRARSASSGSGAAGKRAKELKALAQSLAFGGDQAERARETLDRGRMLLHWSLATIPAIGFIGTVRGILEALAKAGDVAGATDRLQRAEVIAELSGELGLAFSTTFFALLASIAIGLLAICARVRESRCLELLAEGDRGR